MNYQRSIINLLYKMFYITLNPDAPLTIEEKRNSLYSGLFVMAAKNYKIFNRYFRKLLSNKYSNQQILYQFFNLIEDRQIVVSNLKHYNLFLAAEKQLLGTNLGIMDLEIAEKLANRVFNNLSKLNTLARTINPDYTKHDFNLNQDKTITVQSIIKNLVKQIQIQEENLKFCNSNETKLRLYIKLQPYKVKLFKFILKTDILASGDMLSPNQTLDLNYIKKQFNKFPMQDSNNFTNSSSNAIKSNKVLNLFENNDYKKEQIQHILTDLKSTIKLYNDLQIKLNGKIKEQQKLEPIVVSLINSTADKNQAEENQLILREARLTREISELQENLERILNGVFDSLIKIYQQEFYLINKSNVADTTIIEEQLKNYVHQRIKEFFDELSLYQKPKEFTNTFITNKLLSFNIICKLINFKEFNNLQEVVKELIIDLNSLFNHQQLLDIRSVNDKEEVAISTGFKGSFKNINLG